jgi:hypothetical protein
VRRRDQILIHVIDVLPQIFGSSFAERRYGIEMSSNLQYAASDRREYLLHRSDDAVIERVDGAVRPRLTDASYDMRLDVPRFYLDEYSRPRSDRFERLRQRRNGDTWSESVRSQLIKSRGGDRDCGTLRHAFRMNNGIVMNNHYAIAGRVHIQLDALSAKVERPLERGYAVFGQRVVRAAVRNSEWCGTAVGQLNSGV